MLRNRNFFGVGGFSQRGEEAEQKEAGTAVSRGMMESSGGTEKTAGGISKPQLAYKRI